VRIVAADGRVETVNQEEERDGHRSNSSSKQADGQGIESELDKVVSRKNEKSSRRTNRQERKNGEKQGAAVFSARRLPHPLIETETGGDSDF
jgi:hypothetical protein